MIADAEKYKNQDAMNMKRVNAKNELEELCYSIKTALGDFTGKLSVRSIQFDSTLKFQEISYSRR